MTLEKNVKYSAIGIGLATFAAGAYRAYQEDVLGVTNHTLESEIINASLFAPIALGGLVGFGMGATTWDDKNWSVIEKTGLTIGVSTFGVASAGAVSYAGTALGYFTGKTALYLAKNM